MHRKRLRAPTCTRQVSYVCNFHFHRETRCLLRFVVRIFSQKLIKSGLCADNRGKSFSKEKLVEMHLDNAIDNAMPTNVNRLCVVHTCTCACTYDIVAKFATNRAKSFLSRFLRFQRETPRVGEFLGCFDSAARYYFGHLAMTSAYAHAQSAWVATASTSSITRDSNTRASISISAYSDSEEAGGIHFWRREDSFRLIQTLWARVTTSPRMAASWEQRQPVAAEQHPSGW